MDHSALWTTVRNRALDDDGVAGLFAPGAQLITGIFNTMPPQETEGEFVVWDVESTRQIDAFRTATYEVFMRFHVFVDTPEDADSQDAHDKASKIINRLRGDWQDQSVGTAPTFGFHRYSPGTMSGSEWKATDISHRFSNQSHTSDSLHFIETYFVLVQQAGA